MKVDFYVEEIERKTFSLRLPEGMDVSAWTNEQMDAPLFGDGHE